MTRRELAALLVAVPAAAQATASAEPPKPEDQLVSARDDLRQAATQLDKAKLDVTTEPAFHFKA